MASSESEIRALLDGRAEAMWAKDIDRLMSFYSSDIIYFDVVPPLQYVGSDALRSRFLHWFDGFDGPISQDTRDLNLSVSGDIAVACMIVRSSEARPWVRATSVFQRSGDRWLVTHEHVSVPVDLVAD
jgi:ketosteroid isomerase-like protein